MWLAGTVGGAWTSVLQLSPTAKSYGASLLMMKESGVTFDSCAHSVWLAGGYSALAQLSSGEVLCMWEGPCTDKGANSLSEFCLASIQV